MAWDSGINKLHDGRNDRCLLLQLLNHLVVGLELHSLEEESLSAGQGNVSDSLIVISVLLCKAQPVV